jgi:predicted O-linked N-acetylglucosamine transferase (SPINDLY family)
MAASILKGALPKGIEGDRAAQELIVKSEEEYEARVVELGRACRYEGHRLQGRLAELRKLLYEARWTSALFDTKRWVRDLEKAYSIVWNHWVTGTGGDIWLD